MIRLNLSLNEPRPLKLLCLGAHADDIEIGCGGTILRLASELQIAVRWIVLSGGAPRADEALRSAAELLENVSDKNVEVKSFRDGYFPFQGAEIKDFFEFIKHDYEPDLIFTHRREGDAHQDHRLVGDLTHNTFRDHFILEYEIPKYDGDLGNPSFYVPLSAANLRRKVDIIHSHFATQRQRQWFSGETFMAIARLRGIGCNAPDGVAEAFYTSKIVL